jgi:hypothetical protein
LFRKIDCRIPNADRGQLFRQLLIGDSAPGHFRPEQPLHVFGTFGFGFHPMMSPTIVLPSYTLLLALKMVIDIASVPLVTENCLLQPLHRQIGRHRKP